MTNSKITAFIVEDEPSAREVLKAYLAKYCPQVEVVGEAKDAREAIEGLHRVQPQLVFLDVELPYGNAFDILDACRDIHFETIFVTAYSEYSLRALNESASYYLLKPISIEELILAVNKVEKQIEDKAIDQRNRILLDNLRESNPRRKQIVLPTLEGFEVVKIEDIVRLQGNGNFTDLYLRNKSKKMVCRFLKHFEEILPPPFLRVHKSHIVNLDCVTGYLKTSGGLIQLEDGEEIELSPSYKEAFLKAFR